jgi:hypothetical protein
MNSSELGEGGEDGGPLTESAPPVKTMTAEEIVIITSYILESQRVAEIEEEA